MPECAACDAEAVVRCGDCRDHVCAEHEQKGRGAALNLFGPFFISKDERICRLCYRLRMWEAWRALVAIIGITLIVVAFLNDRGAWAAAGALLAVVVWDGIAAYNIRSIKRDRDAREDRRARS